MFHTIKSEKHLEKWENKSFPLTGGTWSNSDRVTTERPGNIFSGIIIVSPKLLPIETLMPCKPWNLDTIENSSIIKNLTSNNLFLKVALDLSFKQSSFIPGLFQDQNEWWFYLYLLLILL